MGYGEDFPYGEGFYKGLASAQGAMSHYLWLLLPHTINEVFGGKFYSETYRAIDTVREVSCGYIRDSEESDSNNAQAMFMMLPEAI